MKTYYRDPQVEEGQRNIILQNRCGNRLTLLVFADHTELEFLYKPNAFRRKEFRARNFSSRDNYTNLFGGAVWPEVSVGRITDWGYDPFVTRLQMRTESGAQNTLTVVNLADENCFAIAARQPLLVAFRPHARFDVRDGLLLEHFTDRGEAIVSFIKFPGFEASRYRVTDDGQHVLQLLENDVVLVGGEESIAQAERAVARLAGRDLLTLIADTERAIAPVLGHGAVTLADDPRLQRVLDANRRMTWSGIDAGGACFGALNRIYHLIWTRDGSMAAATLARAGWPDVARVWTPFLLANPAVSRTESGELRREFLQLVGTRWTKAEDDGIYYAILSLFALVQSTGEQELLHDGTLDDLLAILDSAIASRFDARMGLFGSDTLGEDALAASPYYGYDVVNGSLAASHHKPRGAGPAVSYAYGLYQNSNMYNCLRMAQWLMALTGDAAHAPRQAQYETKTAAIARALQEQFVADDGTYRAMLLQYDDGTSKWLPYGKGVDYWEYAWAVSAGPFMPDPSVALASTRRVAQEWASYNQVGYCPWNFIARHLREAGLASADFRAMLEEEVTDALRLTVKYPMAPLVTEYAGAHEGWRGLPFQTGSLNLAAGSLLLMPLPLGIAVRGSALAARIDGFCYRTTRLTVTATGSGDAVAAVRVNGTPLPHALQLPEQWLPMGATEVVVTRGTPPESVRLYGSTATLRDVQVTERTVRYTLDSPFAAQLTFEQMARAKAVRVHDGEGRAVPHRATPWEQTGMTLLEVEACGGFVVEVDT